MTQKNIEHVMLKLYHNFYTVRFTKLLSVIVRIEMTPTESNM